MKLLKQVLAALGILMVVAIFVVLVTPKATHAIVATLVHVVNDGSSPIPIFAVDPQHGFTAQGTCIFDTNTVCSIPSLYNVPAGQTAVIELVSGWCVVPNGVTSVVSSLGFQYLSFPITVPLIGTTPVSIGTNALVSTFSQSGPVYISGGTSFSFLASGYPNVIGFLNGVVVGLGINTVLSGSYAGSGGGPIVNWECQATLIGHLIPSS
jgi:hypothetical protein